MPESFGCGSPIVEDFSQQQIRYLSVYDFTTKIFFVWPEAARAPIRVKLMY